MAPDMTDLQKQNDQKSTDVELQRANSDNHPDGNIQTPVSLQEHYRFVDLIGHGAQANIYLAERLSDHTKVAIKQLNIGSVKNWKAYDLFHREADVLSKLHINGVAKFYEAIDCLEDEPPCSYIVQEYIEGTSLGNLLKKGHRFEVREVYDILIQLLDILDELHHQNPPVIHRDIKPSNIMLSRSENGEYQVKLIDFGAVANPQVQGGGSTVAGTFGYMPPEQLMGKTVPGSDIYALAAVAVHIFSGKSPADLPSKDFRLIFEPSMEQMPPELLNTLRKMLEPKVDERLCDVDDIKHRFYKFRDNDYKINQKPSAITKDLDTMLKKVRYIGETGNMDVWQSLADETPRPIPKLLYYAESENEYIGFIERIPDMTEKIGAMPSILIGIVCFLLLLMLSKGLLIGVLFANIILAPILLVVALVARKLAKTAWFRILVFVSMMVLVSCFTSVETDYLMYSFFAFCIDVLAGIACFVLPCGTRESQIKELAYSSTINPDKYNELLCFGRKMIATIVDVKYEPAKNAYIRCK